MKVIKQILRLALFVSSLPVWIAFLDAVNQFYIKRLYDSAPHMRNTLIALSIWIFFWWIHDKMNKRGGRS